MKRPWLLTLISANLIALLVLVFVYPQFMVSPGPLIPAHKDLNTDCFACHAPLRGVAPARCVSCHVLSDIGVRTTQGEPLGKSAVKTSFHQDLITQDCIACHTDHAGPRLTQHSRKPFSHSLLRAAVLDQCANCHEAPRDTMHAGLDTNCGQCHRQQAWKPATFDHEKWFALVGDHAAPCATCHAKADFSQYTCYGCHEHTPRNIQAEHAEEGIRDFQDCVRCHRSADDDGGHGESGDGHDDD